MSCEIAASRPIFETPEGPVPTLPHYLRPGLRLVFIGYNPAIYSARAGHYYARPGNVFWRQLSESGLVPRPVGPEDDARLMDEAGIGFVDLCPRPTVRAEHLTPEEIAAGARRLRCQLLEYAPRVAVFSGKGIYAHFARVNFGIPAAQLARRPYGEQPERLEGTRGVTRLWVIPSSSGLASRWHRERLLWLRRLRDALNQLEEETR
jgi:TDG/mug DNA glycosylase family protein